jgi:hypothetical protein
LGWQASTLAPLAANRLANTFATGSYFLSSIWMSGYGIAAAPTSGNLFFSTGNSGPGTYDGVRNIQESVAKVDPQLVNLLDIFTPSNENVLDASDGDLSSGGVLLLPSQPGPFPNLAVTAGKTGRMFLLNRASLGRFTPGGPNNVLDIKKIGNCWCGPSYFTGPDGVGRVVSSGGGSNSTQITVWKVQTSPTVAFVQEGAALPVASGQDPGTFTTVSSNGTQAGTAIIWATGRPTDPSPATVNLYAFAATPSSGTLSLLFSSPAGSWPNTGGNANIVPLVANGHVFVASNQQLTIFGLGGHPFVARAAAAAESAALDTNKPPHEITGVLEHVDGPVLTLRTRAGKTRESMIRKLFVGSKPASWCPDMPTRSKEPMIRPARYMRRPSREQRIRPRFGRSIADDPSASRPATGQQSLAREVRARARDRHFELGPAPGARSFRSANWDRPAPRRKPGRLEMGALRRGVGRPRRRRNCEIRRFWGVVSIADMLPAPQINDVLHRGTFAAVWESP